MESIAHSKTVEHYDLCIVHHSSCASFSFHSIEISCARCTVHCTLWFNEQWAPSLFLVFIYFCCHFNLCLVPFGAMWTSIRCSVDKKCIASFGTFFHLSFHSKALTFHLFPLFKLFGEAIKFGPLLAVNPFLLL